MQRRDEEIDHEGIEISDIEEIFGSFDFLWPDLK